MRAKLPSFTIGIEEKYLLVDRDTRDLVSEPPPDMIAKCEARLQGQVGPEYLQTQIEVGSRVCPSLQEARDDLANFCGTVAEVAGEFGDRADCRVDPSIRSLARSESDRQGTLRRS